MKRLILGSIPEDFDPEKDIPLGPFCFLDREHVYQDWEMLSFQPDPFPQPEAIAKACQLTCVYANNLVPELAENLNRMNNTQYSNQFWRIMIFPWLLTVVQTVVARQARLLQFIEKYKKDKIYVELIPTDVKWKFQDTSDYLKRGVVNPLYNEWLFSRILEQNLPNNWVTNYREIKEISLKEPEVFLEDRSLKQYIKRILKDKLQYSRWSGVGGVGLESLIWSIYLAIKPNRNKTTNIHYNQTINDKIDKIQLKVNISDIITSSLPVCFCNLQMLKIPNPRTRIGRLRLIGSQIYYGEKAKYFLGLCLEGGERLVCTQHGGYYGRTKACSYYPEVEYKQHSFFSWGWSEQENYTGNIKPMPSPLLAKYCEKHKRKTSDLILIGSIAYLYNFRLDTTYLQPLQSLEYRKNKVVFLENLKSTIFQNASYRPYFTDHGAINDCSYIKKKFPKISICKGNLHSEILKCKLLVLDHPGTTLSIAMVANIPTIGFWGKNHWALSRQAVPIFKAMEKTGLIFETGAAAAEKVNEIWNEVETWWTQPDIQKVRENFCHLYARTKRSWRLEWIKELWKL